MKKAKVTFNGKLLKYNPTRGANKIIKGHIPSSSWATTAPTALCIIDDESPGWVTGNGQILQCELLDDGQGKLSLDMDISDSSSDDEYPLAPPTTTTTTTEHAAYELLCPPIIKSTGVIATGATTKALRTQNKAQRNKKLLQQPATTQWTKHDGATILPPAHWEQQGKTSADKEMAPQGLALQHKAAQLLRDWENFGCLARMGCNWTLSKIQAAINRGPHQSALEPEAIAHFEVEVRDKVEKGQACVVLWDDIKSNHPRQLKVLPVAAIPHKS
jgi:hypothetical protein